jgi:hypothetical protein
MRTLGYGGDAHSLRLSERRERAKIALILAVRPGAVTMIRILRTSFARASILAGGDLPPE